MRMVIAAGLALASVAGMAPAREPAAAPARMNDIQVVGSHNSFKAQIPAAVMEALRRRDPKTAAGLDYYHLPLAAQLDRGVRQLEIDIFADPKGGRYADPAGERLARAAGERTGFDRAAMLRPGYKVFHVPDVDYLSTCVTLLRCLGEVDRWSRAHPNHLPIMLTINAADLPASAQVAAPLPLDDATLLDALDREIRQAIPGRRLITPDEVRGAAPTLAAAVRGKGWPTLTAARGRIYVLFDVRAAVSQAYRAAHPALRGRAMFGWYPDGDPDAAIQIVQDPLVDRHRADIALLDRVLGCGGDCVPALPPRVVAEADGHGITLDGAIRGTSGVAQVLLLQYLEGMPAASVGWGRADAATLQRLGALHAALFAVFTRPRYMAAHQASLLGRRIVDSLASGPRLQVLMGHDTNVTAVAAVLGVDLVAPGYATNDVPPGGALLFERVRDTRTGGRFIRVSYRTQAPGVLRAGGRAISVVPLVMAGCARPLCPTDRVVAAIEARIAPPLRDR